MDDVAQYQVFQIGEVTVEPERRALRRGDLLQRLEPRVMGVLQALADANGKVVSRTSLLDTVWGHQEVSEEVLTRAISHIRKAFKQLDPTQVYLETVPKSGYRLARPVKAAQERVQSSGQSFEASTHSREAYDLFRQGQALNARINGRLEIPIACELLSEAVRLDPNFADAYSELSHSFTLICTYVRGGATPENLSAVELNARRALELNPDLAFAMVNLAIAEFTRGHVVKAIRLCTRALEIEPGNPEVVMRLGYFYAAIGLTRTSIDYLERAYALDPAQGRNVQVLALARLSNGDLSEADALARRAIELQHAFGYDTYAGVAFAMGKYDLAFERINDAWEVMKWMFNEKFDQAAWTQICKLGFSKNRADRMTLAGLLMEHFHDPLRTPEVPLLQGLVRCGDANSFFTLTKRHLPIGRHGSYLSLWADTEPCRDIYTHPDFVDFVNHAGFAEAWSEFGRPDKWPQIAQP